MPRSDEYLDEFAFELSSLDDSTKELVLKGSVEICPCCNELSAYAWQDTNSYDELGDIIPGGFVPKAGTIAHIPTSCGLGSWECGHCHAHLCDRDSVLNSPCYTHSED